MTHISKTVRLTKLNKIRDLACRSLLVRVALFVLSGLPTAVHAQASACVTGFWTPDIPTIGIGTPVTVAEGALTQNVITLSAASVQIVTVTLGTTFGTVVAADIGAAGTQTYSTNGGVTFIAVPASGILTIPAGVTTVQVRTTTINDPLTETAETFSLNINAPTGAVLGAAVCPAGPLTIANLTGAGITVATLPVNGALQVAYTCNAN